MISVDHSEIPPFLHGSEVYQSVNNRGKIEVPADRYVINDKVENCADLYCLLRVLKWWKLDIMPLSMIKFCHSQSSDSWLDEASQILGEDSALRSDLAEVFKVCTDYISCAVRAGRLELVEYFAEFSEHVDSKSTTLITTVACRFDRLECLKILHNNKFRWDVMTCCEAAKCGSLRCLSYLREKGCPWDDQVTLAASEGGHVECLQYAINGKCSIHWKSCRAAASNGNIDCLRFLHQNSAPWGAVAAGGAARHGHFECLQYLHQNDCPWDHSVTSDAAHGGHLECLEYALDNKCPVQGTAVENAAKKGHLSCLQLLLAHRVPVTATAASDAASGGHFDCLSFLCENGCVTDGRVFLRAVTGGHRKCLQYLLERGRTEDPAVCAQAAKGGNLDCLRLLREHNAPWDAATTRAAASGGHLETLRFAIDGGCTMCDDLVLQAAKARIGSTACLQYLLEERGMQLGENGAEFGAALARADFECVKYLLDRGCPHRGVKFDAKSFKGSAKQETELAKCMLYANERGWK